MLKFSVFQFKLCPISDVLVVHSVLGVEDVGEHMNQYF